MEISSRQLTVPFLQMQVALGIEVALATEVDEAVVEEAGSAAVEVPVLLEDEAAPEAVVLGEAASLV